MLWKVAYPGFQKETNQKKKKNQRRKIWMVDKYSPTVWPVSFPLRFLPLRWVSLLFLVLDLMCQKKRYTLSAPLICAPRRGTGGGGGGGRGGGRDYDRQSFTPVYSPSTTTTSSLALFAACRLTWTNGTDGKISWCYFLLSWSLISTK